MDAERWIIVSQFSLFTSHTIRPCNNNTGINIYTYVIQHRDTFTIKVNISKLMSIYIKIKYMNRKLKHCPTAQYTTSIFQDMYNVPS